MRPARAGLRSEFGVSGPTNLKDHEVKPMCFRSLNALWRDTEGSVLLEASGRSNLRTMRSAARKANTALWLPDRLLAVAFGALAILVVVDLALLAGTRMTFAPSSLRFVSLGVTWIAFLVIGPLIVQRRLRYKASRFARTIVPIADGTALLTRYAVLLTVLGVPTVMCTYLTAALALPLWDADLAAIDRAMGFGWPQFVAWTNQYPSLVFVLRLAYHSTSAQIAILFLILAYTGREERLAEFVAIFGVTSILTNLDAALVPAEGAYAYFKPGSDIAGNYTALSGMWHHETLTALRTQAVPVFDFYNVEGLVTFPSFHTVLAIMIAYGFRDYKPLFVLAVIANALVIVGAISEGGHHLIDIFAGAAIATFGITLVTRASCAPIYRHA